jgi:thiamine-phosphate pyrophosphorylase
LREKDVNDAVLLDRARALREITARRGALFIVNDRVDIALLSHADGVHLGQLDLPLAEVRRLSGRRLIVGVSTHSVEQARNAERAGADYIGAGPVFATTTKDAGELLRPSGLKAVRAAVSIPVFAIGGITIENIGQIGSEPGCRVAVSSAVLRAGDPGAAVRELLARLK